jgi:hypothetical protein
MMSGINVKFALTAITSQFSEKSYRLYKIGFTSANIVCAFAIIYMIYMNYMNYVNDSQLSGRTPIVGITLILNFAFTMPFYRTMYRKSKAGPTVDYISYLPVVNRVLVTVLFPLVLYDGYLRYGNV